MYVHTLDGHTHMVQSHGRWDSSVSLHTNNGNNIYLVRTNTSIWVNSDSTDNVLERTVAYHVYMHACKIRYRQPAV